MKRNRFLTLFFVLALILSSVNSVSANSAGLSDAIQKAPAANYVADTDACTTVNLTATADTWMRASNASYNYGGSATISNSPRTSSPQGSLLKWDLSTIPTDATISSVSLTFYITDPSAYAFSLFNLRREWVEGSNDGAAGTGASWTYYGAGTGSWSTSGAANITSDRYNTNLWNASTSTFNVTANTSVSVDLNSSGVAALQGWISTPASNYGLTIQNYSGGSTADYLIFSSSEGTTPPVLNVTYCITTTDPTITTSGTLTAFTTSPGVASTAQTYTVEGENLTANISITAPTGFQLSTNGSTYSSSLTLPQTGGVVNETTIYVRLYSASEGSFSGDIEHTSNPATQVNLAVSGVVSSCSDVSLVASEDTYMSSVNTTNNYGGTNLFKVSSNSSTNRGALIKWDVSSIPSSATISAASLTLYVSTAASQTYNLYNMRQAWVEGTNDSAAGTGASWTYYGAGTGNWGTVGAASTTSDRYDTNLWGAGTSTFSSTGSKTVALNTNGIAVVQGWADGTTDNYGMTIQNYSGSTSSNDLQISSSENTTTANKPKLNITYCASTGPTITTSGTLTAFSSQPGVASAAQTYTVAGVNLTDDITITAPDGFELSTNGSTYNDSLTLTRTDGSVSTTTIYVRLYSDEADTFSGNITHISSGATQVNIAVSGVVMGGWIAYNDCGYIDGQISTKITTYECFTNGESGVLVDYNTGDNTPASVVVATSGTIDSQLTSDYYGAEPNSGTDAYNTFHDYVNMVGGIRLGTSSSYIDLTFTGLDPAQTYTFAATANRANSDYTDRITQFTISDEDSATNASTSGVTVNSNLSVSFVTGYNTVNGYVARWSNIQPGSDGDFSVRFAVDSSGDSYAYGPTVFMLNEEESATPRITTSGTLSEFTSSPGVYSAEQNYSVSGSNLTGDITITAPDDFEISKTSGSGFASSLTLTRSGGSVASTPIYVRFNRATAGTSNGSISHISADATTKNMAVSGIASTVNHAPNQPVLVQPDDDATGVSTPPTLEVTVSDTDLDDLDVTFYGREVGGSSGDDFTIVAIPDTQNYATSYPTVFTNHLQWISTNKTGSNIIFATAVGDLVNTPSSTTEYGNADTAYDTLDTGNVSYSVGPGNHDMMSGTLWANYFSTSRFSGKSYYGGSYDNYNTYSLFSASGMDFILINLQYSPTTAILDWADALLTTYSDRRAIVEQHDILNVDNSWNNQASYTALRDHDNLFLMLCGHMHTSSDGAAYVAGTGTGGAGQTIHIVMADYQDFAGSGYLRILRFSPTNDMIYMTTYSPISDSYITSTSNYDQADLVYDMDGSAAFEEIGTVSGVTSSSNASITWPDLENETEYEWFAVASDGALSATSSTWSFTTGAAVNHAPVITESDPRAVTMSEDGAPTAFSQTLHATDEDAGDTLTWSISTQATNGTATASGTGTSKAIGYTPVLNYNGSDSFVVQVSDGKSGTDTITVNVTIQAVNDAPVLGAIGNKSVNELVQLSFNATASDVDVPANTLTYSLANGTAGSVPTGAAIVAGTGAFSWTPTEAQGPGTYTFDVCVSDGTVSDCETITVTVNEVNIAPVLGAIGNKSVNELVQLSFNATASDIDVPANNLTFSLANGASGAVPTGAAIVAGTGAFSWTPTEAQGPGTYTFDVCVSDGTVSDCETITVTVNEGNITPVLAAIGNKLVNELVQLSFIATANDVDLPAQALIYSLANGTSGTVPSGAAINGTSGAFTWTPSEEQGGADYTFDVCVSDGALSDCETISVTVNEINNAPVLNAIGNKSMNELVELTFDADATDSDQPAQTLTYSLANGTAGSVPTGAAIVAGTGAFTWTPTEAQGPGTYTFDVCVSDGTVSDCETITVTVSEVNVAPLLGAIGNKLVNELVQLSFNATASDIDVPANNQTFSLADGTAGSVPTGAAIAAGTGAFTWTPTEAQGPGTYTFDVCVSDGAASDCETITVTVNEVNVTPVLGAIGDKSVDELALLSFTASVTDIDLPANDLTFSLADGTAGSVPDGAVIVAGTGAYTWTPSEEQGGAEYTFDVCVSDGSLSDCETITVTVNEINNAPVLNAIGNKLGNELVELTFDTDATDSDQPAQALTYSLANGASGAVPSGAAINGASGAFTWIPTEAQGAGEYIFDVCVSDGSLSDCETITVTVNEVNNAPVLGVIGNKSVDELVELSFTATANDVDVPANSLTFNLVGAPNGASIDSISGAFNWTPTEAQGAGEYTFDVCVSDGTASDCETIKVTVAEVNVAPVLGVIGSKSVDELVELTFTAIATDADLPANDLAYSLVGAPSGASIEADTGEFSWTPTEAQGPGTYNFNVCVSDGDLSDCETIEVTVNEVINAPVANAQSVSTPEDTPKAITLTGSDADGDLITFIVVDEPQHGTLSGAAPNLTYTPDQGYYGEDSFTFKVSDGTLESELATVSISVTSVNDAPVAVDDLFGANAEDVPLVIDPADLTANDTDVDNLNLELIVIAVGNPVNGSVELDGATITFTPGTNFHGTAEFDYTVSDGVMSDVGHVTIEFTSVNDMPVFTEGGSTLVVMSQNGSPIAFNLTLHASDVDGDTLTWSIHTQAGNGAASASGTGASMVIGYTPLENYTGDDNFVVQVEDGNGGVATIIVNVTINPIEDIYPYKVFLPVLIK